MSKLKPVNGRVICTPPGEDSTTEGGIVLPGTWRGKSEDKPEVGIVVSFDGSEEHPLNGVLRPGLKILFNKFAALEIQRASEGNKKYFVLVKDSILAIYENEEVPKAG